MNEKKYLSFVVAPFRESNLLVSNHTPRAVASSQVLRVYFMETVFGNSSGSWLAKMLLTYSVQEIELILRVYGKISEATGVQRWQTNGLNVSMTNAH